MSQVFLSFYSSFRLVTIVNCNERCVTISIWHLLFQVLTRSVLSCAFQETFRCRNNGRSFWCTLMYALLKHLDCLCYCVPCGIHCERGSPCLWNALPQNLTLTMTNAAFKVKLKTHIFFKNVLFSAVINGCWNSAIHISRL